MQRTIDNCSLIKKMVRKGEGDTEIIKDEYDILKCMGYGKYGDEPCEACQDCKLSFYYGME